MEQKLEKILKDNECFENDLFRKCYSKVFTVTEIEKLFVNFYALTQAFPIYGFNHCYTVGNSILKNEKLNYLPTIESKEEYLAIVTSIISSEYSDGKNIEPSKFHSNLFLKIGNKLNIDVEKLKKQKYQLTNETIELLKTIEEYFSNNNFLAGFSVLFTIESTALRIIDSIYKAFQKYSFKNGIELTEEEVIYFSLHQIIEIEHEEGVNEILKILKLNNKTESELEDFIHHFSKTLSTFWKSLI